MTIYNVYIYTSNGTCIFQYDYTSKAQQQQNDTNNNNSSNSSESQLKQQTNQIKLLYGLTYSLNDIVQLMKPNNTNKTKQQATQSQSQSSTQHTITLPHYHTTYEYSTLTYKLYTMLSYTGYRIILLTSLNSKGSAGYDILYSIYKVLVDTYILCNQYNIDNNATTIQANILLYNTYACNKIHSIINQSPIYNT